MKTRLFCLLFLTILTCSVPSFAIAQTNSESLREPSATPEKARESTITRKRERSSILESIWNLLKAKREQEPALSSRSNICEITPGLLGETNLIYSDRPLFLWQGEVTNLEVNLYSPFSLDAEQEILWAKTINDQSRNISYTGESLQPGKIYDWEIVTDSQTNRRRISFKIIDAEERNIISQELAQLETELTASGANKEEITLAKAKYFAEKDLWSDSLQQLHSLETSSDNYTALNQEIISYICESANFSN
ncbi:MAG: DUF928 domain-containing protein [Xenococcaceae cyanobacterium MO_188.B19]|nr:DUF928 domain-containing protein [Xenococcaceae cyanobacterium MO_188.B19]